MNPSNIETVNKEEDLMNSLCEKIQKIYDEVIQNDEIFKVGLSGGSMASYLVKVLPKLKTDWSKWRLFFCDERVVPVESNDSNYGFYKTNLIGKVPLEESQFIKINPNLTAEEASKDYIQKMSVYFPPDSLPRFHLLLLGIGPDGHICSLFPNHKLLDETSLWVGHLTNSPKPPSSRITLTLPVINNSKYCIFALSGPSKADIVKRILKQNEDVPASRVLLTDGTLFWLLDKEAGGTSF